MKKRGSNYLDFSRMASCIKMTQSLYAVMLAVFPLLLVGLVVPASSATCAESCVINVVHERMFAANLSNWSYNYVPTDEWAAKDCCISNKYAIDIGRPAPLWYVAGYLVGWHKAYYDGQGWRNFGGDAGKYFLTQITPFHATADVIFKGTLPGSFPGIREALNALYPNGCSDLPSKQPDQAPNLDTGKPECNDQGL